MLATAFDIIDRPHHPPARRANLSNFRLREYGQLPATVILENPHITLYSLDFENNQATFVETPADVDLSQAPFYFVTQYEEAERVLTISFETMLALAQSVSVDASRLIFIYSVGRCGSTLASQIFSQVPSVGNFSEPYVLSQLVVARNMKLAPDDVLVDLAETEEESRQRDKQRRERLGPLVPLIAQYDPNRPLPHAGTLSLMWLRVMERYVEYCDMGMEMLAIRYESWRAAPQKTAEAMLDYCQCRPSDITAVYDTLTKDSQADSRLSRDALGQRQRVLADHELEELNWHLQHHPFIHEADFAVPNTMKQDT